MLGLFVNLVIEDRSIRPLILPMAMVQYSINRSSSKKRSMKRVNVFKKVRNNYVIWHANRIQLLDFPSSPVVRKKVVFSGRVQKVGFRLEIYTIAERMKLKGRVKNLKDGSVELEVQGEEQQISFLVHCMKSLKRASVKKVTMSDLPINENEENFSIVK